MFTTWNAHRTLDRLFDDVMHDVTGAAFGMAQSTRNFEPAFDVRTSEDDIVLECDVPGHSQEDLEVTLEGRTLTVKGQRRYQGQENDRVWLGRRYGSFEKSFTLPELIDSQGLSANLANGVLTVRVPKRPEAKPRRIAIGGGSSEPKQLGEKRE